MAVRITCINKAGGAHENPYLAISHLGWINETSKAKGKSTRLEIYEFIVDKGGKAYVKDNRGNIGYLEGKISPRETRYVKTEADDVTSDNLLKLPECK